MKSYVTAVRGYYQEYRDIDIDALKSHFIVKDFKKIETKETLIKKLKQRKRVWEISSKLVKIVINDQILKYKEDLWSNKPFICKGGYRILMKCFDRKEDTTNALLLRLMYELR